ncbi:NADP-dependent oxidoreductase domain-containing protein [Massariosphaeria phaeospora]|uniref:NADP-dependent oxidoreductase domain-containing protein n=1 Tax=Massariosphaeria phaeospora TaxID=100035 RepID=A0A7C8M8Q3_9PLEO|nr:NADP-dependent oxidoreductase domain-containing protein [Massariosphaeria phaeospora]
MASALTELLPDTKNEAVEAPKMKYTRLGKSGLKISRIILGAMSYGDKKAVEIVPWVIEEEKALPLLEHAFKRGINTWDTADFYGQGSSERIIGKALKKYAIPREQVVILSKVFFGIDPAVYGSGKLDFQLATVNDGHMVNRVGLSRKHILDAVDASVERLGTYIDVLQIHRLDHDVPPEEIMKALNDVVESGKVRYLGASSMAAWEFQMLNNLAATHNYHPFISMQNYHNLLYREEEREMHPYCSHSGIGLIPWSPLAQGVLARPWAAKDSTLRAQHNEYLALIISERDQVVVDRLQQVAARLGVSMATVATAWSLSKGVNPIVGLSSKQRIDEAVEMVHFELGDGDVRALEEVYVPKAQAPVF